MTTKCNDSWTGADKRKHFLACLALSIVFPPVGILAAVTKELNDARQNGNHFCLKDLVWDFLGIAVGCAGHIGLVWLAKLLF